MSQAHPSVSILMDSKGNVYYSDLKQVWKITPAGTKTIAVPNVHSHELFIDSNDNLYGEHLWSDGDASNSWGHFTWRLNATGQFEKLIPNTRGFLTNYSFNRDQLGRMYWAGAPGPCQKIMRRNADGSISTLGNLCMKKIRWMTVSPEGTVYFIDDQDLKKMDVNGQISMISPNIPELSLSSNRDDHYISGLSLDRDQTVFVADFSSRKVRKYKGNKKSIVAETRAPWSPAGTLLAPNGDFWILEYSNTNEVRVEKITASGQRIIF
ncbi:MAG TPA: hypothetical protein DDZ56_11815 [Cytophagales bacterium]|nr:hypothetical protein [Cytophagales bacterium]